MSSSPRGELFIVSAPSGGGKTTLINALLAQQGGPFSPEAVAFSISHTTRPPRQGEENGRHYHFVSEDRFREMADDGQFLEWATVHGYSYGTSLAEVLPRLERGVDVLLDIDVQGAASISRLAGELLAGVAWHTIFVLPPGYAELRQRLEKRNLDSADEIDRRLRVALAEVQRYEEYKYVIVNDEVASAARELGAIILEKRLRRQRIQSRVEQVLRDFATAGGTSPAGPDSRQSGSGGQGD